MTPERYQKVVEMFQAACEQSPERRAEFLREASAGDEELLREVETMLAADSRSGEFLHQPPDDVAADVLSARNDGSLIGKRLGDYEVLARLGEGGMGVVYLAKDTQLERKAALKMLPFELAADPNWSRRFEQEARIISSLNHPNIVTIYGIGQVERTTFLATEFVEGRTLREELAQGQLTEPVAIDIALQVAAALASAHAAGIVHRDIKPENIMLRPDGIVKVLDFGLAKSIETDEPADHRTTPGMVMGTVRYMSPEQACAVTLDARSDLYSLGVVLCEMAQNPVGTELERIISKALRVEREQRYQSASELSKDLKTYQKRLELAAIRKPVMRRLWGAVAILIVVVLAIASAVWFNSRGPKTGVGVTEVQGVAVLPFVNAGGDAKTEYLADALSESLIESLSQLPQLKVIASRSTFRFKGKDDDVTEVGKALGASSVVSGRVMQRGDSLLVSVDLVNARDKTKIWSESYDRKAAYLQSVQNDLVRSIAAKLHVSLTAPQQKQLSEGGTSNAEAHRLYLTALYYGLKNDVESRKTALDFYNRAISADPKFARAYVGASAVYVFLASVGAGDPKEYSSKAQQAVSKALELQPDLADAHSVLAVIHANDWDWSGADREFKRALALSPNHADAHGNYALFLMTMKRHVEALAENKRAQELDPLHFNYRSYEGTILYNGRKYDEALQVFYNILRMRPNHGITYAHIGYAQNAKGTYREAIASFQQSLELLKGSGSSTNCYLGYAYAKSGQRERALDLLRELRKMKDSVSPAELAILYLGLGDKEGAMMALDKAYAVRDLQLQYLAVDPHYDELHSDERFQALVQLLGLPK